MPSISAPWQNANIKDDPVVLSNVDGTIAFATAGPNTRTTQVYINTGDNSGLDGQGFAPFGKVTSGLDVVKRINSAAGQDPDQGKIESEGNAYLRKNFPQLDYTLMTVIA
jgi:peptidyl-prolyl cis-trans isomerase A (cyclophilin A)